MDKSCTCGGKINSHNPADHNSSCSNVNSCYDYRNKGEYMQKVTPIRVASPFSPHTLETKHVKPYVFRRINHMPAIRLQEFWSMVAKFIRKSGEWNATVQQTLLKIDSLMRTKPDDFCWYIIEESSRMVGYFYAEISVGDYDEVCCDIHHVFIDPKARHANLLQEVEGILVDFARRRGAIDLRFLTGRIPRAFFRKLKGNWKTDAVRIKRCV